MFRGMKEFLLTHELRQALHCCWLEIAIWPLLAYAVTFAGLTHGLPAGLGVVALAWLTRLRPEVTRLPSPDGRRALLSCHWSFGRIFFLLALALAGAAVRLAVGGAGLAASLLIALGILLAASALLFMFVIPFLMLYCMLWAFHPVLIVEGGRLRAWHVRFCVSQSAETEYLWLPDGDSLLVAQSDEDDCWYLYVYDLKATGRGARFPYNVILGRYPHLRRITLEEARARVAPYLRESVPEHPAPAPAGRDYGARCRRFFVWFNPQCVNN
jgi:hypothetical protein